MKVIEIKNLHKTYNDSEQLVHAIRGIDLSFEAGEFTAIAGPSGCGKTTLLNMLGGLDNPSEGEIRIGGEDVSKLKSSERINFRLNNIGFVFQAYNLIPVLTARENVEFIMHLQGRPKSERERRTRRPARQQAFQAVGGTAAKGGRCPGPGLQTQICPGRRADRQPGFEGHGKSPGYHGKAEPG
jgi:ABC-type lipoprotein export system ATPase subunit